MLKFPARAKPSANPQSTAAQQHVDTDDIGARYQAAIAEYGGLKLAESLMRNPEDAARDRTKDTRKDAAPYMELASRPIALAARLEQLETEIPKLAKAKNAALDASAIERSEKTSEKALEKQPRQRAAVLKIAAAAEALSRAMAQEREIRAELAREAPLPSSRYLPMASPYIGGFDDWSSELSAWRRRMFSLGYLN